MPDLVTPLPLLLLVAVCAYLVGTVSFGLVMARVFDLGDLRAIGSGNTGATNVLRTGNKRAAALTLVLDAAKGAIAVLVARALLGADAAQVAGLAAFAGHCFPVWSRFKGGKGVATFLGVVLALSFALGLGACLAWLGTAVAARISSLAALVAAAAAPVLALVLRPDAVLLCALLAALIFVRHAPNIRRLAAGTEPRIGAK